MPPLKPPMTQAEQKRRCRNRCRLTRDAIPAAARQEESRQIAARLYALPQYRSAETIFLYLSFGSEVETEGIARRILLDGKRLAVPQCIPSTHEMRLFGICSPTQLEKGAYGILEPKAALIQEGQLPEVPRAAVALALVPGLCFDRQGYRIGYGGGYYDRFLDGYQGVAAGLAYASCLCDRLPREDCDKPVDVILTGTETVWCRGR